MDEMALAIGKNIRLDTCFALNDGSHVLLTLSTLERKSEGLPSPLRVNNVGSAVQTTFRKQQLPNFNFQ